MKTKPKAMLFTDEHKTMSNSFGKPVSGWISGTEPNTIFNPMGFGMAWIVVCDKDGNPMYNQPMIVENPGAIVICQIDDRIGLIESQRIAGERIISNSGDYVRTINEQNLWKDLVDSAGETVWEAPRGLITSTTPESLEALVLKTARIEASEEAGFHITNTRIVGRVNANTTFFFHAQYVVHSKIESIGNANPEQTELIGKTKLFTIEEIAELQRQGRFVDGLTLAAMAICGIALPQQ